MHGPLYVVKADLFKMLGHPVRIRILELLSERDQSVSEMLPQVGIEAANLSQHLTILRYSGLVASGKSGSTVLYTLSSPRVAELLRVARGILTEVLDVRVEQLSGLREST
ncbi:ArsR/SmtB family transcription factor [Virgisporangium aurantiacum]|uniref:Putative transcriptional regulatory protein ArsR n=1 Tax=Virgisporangium aurantiacum TaxID=175570 RepID=A0A8J3ZMV7_9ACTN|nr:metalloregulator ArsR/SmtB family transcription factor [Virgisporangium aurantiacum]GIJ64461.1 putative transcriptional regulatory protein ArsR [Virgisporangium aurantiacum]